MIDLLSIGLLLLGAVGVGRELLRWWRLPLSNPFERAAFAAGLGYGVLILVTLFLGLVGLLRPGIVMGVTGLWIVFGCYRLGVGGVSRHATAMARTLRDPWHALLVCLILGSLLFLALKAAAPPHGATDPLAYQLALPKIFLQKGYLSFEATITGALYPDNMNMLYVVGLALRNGALAQLIHWSTALLCVVGLIGLCERYLSRDAGLLAGIIFLSMPLVTVFAPLGYIDVGLCFFQFLALWALANWVQEPGRRSLLLAAVLTGLAIGTKHQGLATIAVAVPVVLVASWRQGGRNHALRSVALFGAVALSLALPWYVRAWAMAGNPLWPLANGLFGGTPFGAAPVILSGYGGLASGSLGGLIPSLAWWSSHLESMSPWSWAFMKGGPQKATGIYFIALLPVALLGWRHRHLRVILLFCLVYYGILVRALHMNPRYGMVLFVFASAAAGWGAHYLAGRIWRPAALLFRVVFVLSVCLNVAWQYHLFTPVRDVVFGRETWGQFLRDKEYNYGVYDYANTNLPAGSKVLLQGMVRGFYLDAPYLWDHPHQAVLNYGDHPTQEGLLEALKKLGVTHVARVIRVSPSRHAMGYPQYFLDPFHESFRQQFLKLVYRDQACVLFEIDYGVQG
ncbi:MAG: phospholipid carrier-dependent glycosyltransferase [Gemmatimonadetes bacterium]|nr:phospholipid carrier-dependent glycosyltransferase [Gemmatimonadota bacterium]